MPTLKAADRLNRKIERVHYMLGETLHLVGSVSEQNRQVFARLLRRGLLLERHDELLAALDTGTPPDHGTVNPARMELHRLHVLAGIPERAPGYAIDPEALLRWARGLKDRSQP